MASSRLAIHVLPDSNPTNVLQMVMLLSSMPDETFGTAKALIEYLREAGQNANDWVQSTASSMGILLKTEDGIRLSSDGLALASMRDDARGDILHFLMYTGWTPNAPTEFLQSWAYRLVCDQYWEQGTVALTSNYLHAQIGEVINIAEEYFPQIGVSDFDEVSFSRKSLRGVHNWLEAVSPPVIIDDGQGTPTFSRRSFCPPELVVLAIAHVLEQEENALGIDVLLTPEKRESISRICLLDPNAFDRVLDWALPIYPHLITPGTTAGFYGRFIRLHKFPELRDVVR